MKRLGVICALVGVVLAMAATASATQIWGVAWDSANTRSEVFKVDPSNGKVDLLGYVNEVVFSDIAVTPDGKVYAVGASPYNSYVQAPNGTWVWDFNDFFRLNPQTGAIQQTWSAVAPRRFNALTADSNSSLLAIEGGGVSTHWGYPGGPDLYGINLDGGGMYSSVTNLGTLPDQPSDGDIVQNPDGTYYGGALWQTGPTSDIYQIDPSNPAAATLAANISNKAYISGLAYDYASGVLYGSAWDTKWLYQLNLGGGTATALWDLSVSHAGGDALNGYIYGLDNPIPEPVTVLGMFLGLGSVGVYLRRRRMM